MFPTLLLKSAETYVRLAVRTVGSARRAHPHVEWGLRIARLLQRRRVLLLVMLLLLWLIVLRVRRSRRAERLSLRAGLRLSLRVRVDEQLQRRDLRLNREIARG